MINWTYMYSYDTVVQAGYPDQTWWMLVFTMKETKGPRQAKRILVQVELSTTLSINFWLSWWSLLLTSHWFIIVYKISYTKYIFEVAVGSDMHQDFSIIFVQFCHNSFCWWNSTQKDFELPRISRLSVMVICLWPKQTDKNLWWTFYLMQNTGDRKRICQHWWIFLGLHRKWCHSVNVTFFQIFRCRGLAFRYTKIGSNQSIKQTIFLLEIYKA